ncbi:hypothetical protein [Kribbella italica]|uniref:Uncharacterized protein n=1 Tax=Kribbella italica TaxID=1540520 RepID=A0A7W9MS16_9ACTN|nr:hypothetical protein [Kribbella italica]MBB5833448.1 hypothetical protein [Kribbella italica]
MDFKYFELSFTFPAELAASILAADKADQYDELVTLFSDEGGIVAAVTVASSEKLSFGEFLDDAIDMATDTFVTHTAEEVDIPLPWSVKLVDRELMSEYFQQVATAPVLPACGPIEDDGLEGAGV